MMAKALPTRGFLVLRIAGGLFLDEKGWLCLT